MAFEVDYGSEANIEKTAREFKKHAGENVMVEWIGGAYYAFGSELAILRLWRAYNLTEIKKNTRMGNSNVNASHYFFLEPAFQ